MAENAPKGFQKVQGHELTGFVQNEEGTVVQGKIVGWLFAVDKKYRHKLYRLEVQLEKSMEVVVAGGEMVKAGPGDVVAVLLNGRTKYLLQYVASQSRVWMKCRGKTEIKTGEFAGNEVWDWESAVESGAKASRGVPPPSNKTFEFDYRAEDYDAPLPDGGDQIPF